MISVDTLSHDTFALRLHIFVKIIFITFKLIHIVPVPDQKNRVVVEIMMPKSEYDTVHKFIAYVEVEKTSA
jgi:hypothetical protein